MSKVSWGVAVAAVAVALVLGQLSRVFYRRAEQFETKARMALAHQRNAQVQVDWLQARVNEQDAELRRHRSETTAAEAEVVVVDRESPPDTSCAPNLAARDRVIASKTGEIVALEGIREAQAGQINLLQASNDELRRALEARPKLYPRIVGPNVGVGVFVGVVGVQANGKPALGVGVGVTLNVFSVRF